MPKSNQAVALDEPDSSDSLTVLRTVDKHIAAKIIRPAGQGVEVEDFSAGAKFVLETVAVHDIHTLAVALTDLAGDPTRFVIRGQLGPNRRPNRDGTVFRRKIKPGSAWQGYFESAPRRWCCVDIDKMSLMSGLSQVTDPETVVRHALGLLGAPWKTATVFWQASSKAGLPGVTKIRLHLWFWFDQPVDDKRLRDKFRLLNKQYGGQVVDEALADAVQIHYTSAPIFDGMADPLPRRQGVLFGETDSVLVELLRLPSIPAKKIEAAPRQKTLARLRSVPKNGVVLTPSEGQQAKSIPVSPSAEVQRLHPKTELYQAILADVLTLARRRHGDGGVGDGERDKFLFAATVAAVNIHPGRLETNAKELAGILVPGKTQEWVDGKLASVSSRVAQHLDGRRDVTQGRTTSPIYSPSIRWFITTLSITDAEMEHLAKLVSEAIRKRRKRAKQPRSDWLADRRADTAWQAIVAAELHYRRDMRPTDAARLLGITERHYWTMLKLFFSENL